MDKITDQIWIGSSQDALFRQDTLKELGITAVLNVALDLDNPMLSCKDFALHKVGLMDGEGNPVQHIDAAISTLLGLVAQGHKILVHCHEGRSRSVCVVAACLYRSSLQFDSLEGAIEHIRLSRPRIDPKPGLIADFHRCEREGF